MPLLGISGVALFSFNELYVHIHSGFNEKKFQGKSYAKSYVPDSARKLLKRWDEEAAHYEAEEKREQFRP